MCKEAQMRRWQDAKEPSKRDFSMMYTKGWDQYTVLLIFGSSVGWGEARTPTACVR